MHKLFVIVVTLFVFVVSVSVASAADLTIGALNSGSAKVVTRPVFREGSCPAPWCEQAPSLYRLEASNNPSRYLGTLISYERPSDWMVYAPIMNKVQELTKELSSEWDKVLAIANWVKGSKIPRAHIYESWPASIIDFWNFPEANCEEASFLLTAMLRLAGIPAMRVNSWNGMHSVTRAFVNGGWIVADATPIPPDNIAPAHVYDSADAGFIPAFQERPMFSLSGVRVPGGSDKIVDLFTLFSLEPMVDKERMAAIGMSYGKVAFPVTNVFLYFDSVTGSLSEDGLGQLVGIKSYLSATDSLCFNNKGSWYATPLDYINPSLYYRTIDASFGSWVGSFYPWGYVETILPTCGTWRVSYFWTNQDMNANPRELAFVDFQLQNESDFVIVRPTSLQPAQGANLYFFNKLVEILARVPSFEMLEIKERTRKPTTHNQ